VQWPLGVDELAVYFYVIARGRLCTEVLANVSIDCDESSGNQLIAMPSRPNASRSEKAIEAHGANVKKVETLHRLKESGTRPL
jgi:hypothetical protein